MYLIGSAQINLIRIQENRSYRQQPVIKTRLILYKIRCAVFFLINFQTYRERDLAALTFHLFVKCIKFQLHDGPCIPPAAMSVIYKICMRFRINCHFLDPFLTFMIVFHSCFFHLLSLKSGKRLPKV